MIYSYIDTLLDKWVEWSEGFLSQKLNSNTNDLNTILGTSGADNPSRALEFYRIGLLNLPLTNSTKAYDSLRNSESVQSYLGYISYLIAKAKVTEPTNSIINNGFNALSSIFLIQQYEEYNSQKISLAGILLYLIEKFPIPNNIDERTYLRYLTAAMFCELNTDKDNFIKQIINNQIPSIRIIERPNNVKSTFNSSNEIATAINNRLSLTGLVYEKGSVFFIGNPRDTNPRGLFYLSHSNFRNFLDDFYEIEFNNLRNNPFLSIFETTQNQNKIADIKSIFDTNNKSQNLRKLMRTLEEGSLEAIKILGWSNTATVNEDIKNVIFYGSPGTGKSYNIETKTIGQSKTRITFHPETDYHSFVGSYKPVMDGINIKYEFVPQAFTKAYCQAWLHPDKPHYLIIEEINRGNCAQIFGDLFQCLDRDETGKSKYEIDCDKDIADYLKKSFAGKGIVDDKIILPSNLYIYATMNTSDQSLFPIDSAFKRRWDWEFVPIDYDDAKQITIEVDTTSKYNWSNFIKNINPKIKELTGSEDKQLGNRFVNPNDKKVTLDQFKSKVLFYLWSEIYKDEFGTQNSIFKYELNGEIKDFQFGELYNDNSTEIVKLFLEFNGIEKEL
jgi:hypothetical protein